MNSPQPFRWQYIDSSGTDFEIGVQHGEQAASQLSTSFPYALERFRKNLGRKASVLLGQLLVDGLVRARFRRSDPLSTERTRGVAHGARASSRILKQALVLPDLVPILEDHFFRWFPEKSTALQFPLLGCASFVAREDNQLFFGRNLDFPGFGSWERWPVVQRIQSPGKRTVLAFTTAGVPFAGITGINEDRLAVALHQHHVHATRWSGHSAFVVAEKMLQTCSTVDEAIAFLSHRSHFPAGGWSYIVVDAKTGRAACVERTPAATGLRVFAPGTARDSIAQTNFFQSLGPESGELAASERMIWDIHCRLIRLEELLSAVPEYRAGTLLPLLTDSYDPYWQRPKITNRTISMAMNIQSVLFDFRSDQVWLAEGEPPIHQGSFVRYSLSDLFSGKFVASGPTVSTTTPDEVPRATLKRKTVKAIHFAACGEYQNALTALGEFDDDLADPEVHYLKGLLELKNQDWARALKAFRSAATRIECLYREREKSVFPPEYFETKIFEARTLDILGKRAEAVQVYEQIALLPGLRDRALKKLIQKKPRFTALKAKRMFLPVSAYAPFQ